MQTISNGKMQALRQMTNQEGVIAALAIDQRGALRKMMGNYREPYKEDIEAFKEVVSQELTPYASAILLDPEYGLPASRVRDEQCGLLLAYEKTGYDTKIPGRLPDVLNTWSVKRLKEVGADACKFLLYYDVDESALINQEKQAFIERIGSECSAEELPFFLEIVTYDATIGDAQSREYALLKPHKVIEAMKEFSKDRYQVDVLKVEVPVNMNYVEGFGEASCYTQQEAQAFFKKQSEVTQLPFIFLSAGVSAELFCETLYFAKEAGSTFNGVLCGRATWAKGVEPFMHGGKTLAQEWLSIKGKANIEELNSVLSTTASSIFEKIQ